MKSMTSAEKWFKTRLVFTPTPTLEAYRSRLELRLRAEHEERMARIEPICQPLTEAERLELIDLVNSSPTFGYAQPDPLDDDWFEKEMDDEEKALRDAYYAESLLQMRDL